MENFDFIEGHSAVTALLHTYIDAIHLKWFILMKVLREGVLSLVQKLKKWNSIL